MEGNGIVNQNDIAKIVESRLNTLKSIQGSLYTIITDVEKNKKLYKKSTINNSIGVIMDVVRNLNYIFNSSNVFNDMATATNVVVVVNNVRLITEALGKIYASYIAIIELINRINNYNKRIKNNKRFLRSIELISFALYQLNQSIIQGSISTEDLKRAYETINTEYEIFVKLCGINEMLKSINILGIKFRIVKIIKIIKSLNLLVRYISMSKPKRIAMAILNIFLLDKVIDNIRNLVISLMILTVVLVPFMLILPILLIGLGLLYLAIKFLFWLISKIAKPNMIVRFLVGTAILLIIIMTLNIISLSLLMIAVIAKTVIPLIPTILLFILSIVAITVSFALLAVAVSFLIPLLIPMVIGFGVMIVTITMLFVIASLLELIMLISLDRETIIKKVQDIITISYSIINLLFSINDNILPDKKKPESWFGKFMSGFNMVGEYLFASAILVMTLITIIAIYAIVLFLRSIQAINLNPDRIMHNINVVLSTSQQIIDLVFGPQEEKKNGEKESFWKKFLNWGSKMLGGIGDIIEMILACAFLTLSVVAILMIVFIVSELRLIQNLNLNPDRITQNVGIVISTARMVVDTIFQPDTVKNEESKKGFIGRLLEHIGGGLISIVKSIMSIGYLAVMLVSIAIIGLIASELKKIQDIELDGPAISQKVDLILTTAQGVIDRIFQRKEPNWAESDDKLRSLFKWAFPGLSSIVEAITAMATVGPILVSIGCLAKIAEHLNTISKFELSDDINKKTQNILDTANGVVTYIIDGNNRVKWSESINITNTLERYSNIFGHMKDIIDQINKLDNVNNNIDTSIDSVIKCMSKIDNYDFASKNSSLIEKFSRFKDLNSIITQYNSIDDKKVTKTIDSFSGFISKIDGANLEKLKTTTNLFAKMAEFSKSISGNFEGLANSLNDKIAPLLEELRDLINDLPNDINNSADKIGKTITLTSTEERGLLTKDMAKAYETKANPGLSEAEITKLVDERMKRQSKQKIESIEAKFEELLNIIKGNGTERGIPVIQV